MHTPSEWHRQTGRLQCTQDQVLINSLLTAAVPVLDFEFDRIQLIAGRQQSPIGETRMLV